MIIKCQHCDVTIEVNEAVSKDFKYTCKKHNPEVKENQAGISNTQFDERFKRGHWMPPPGFQMAYEACPYDTFIPEWAKTNEGIQEVISRAFPKWNCNERQELQAQRWAYVIYCFWRLQYTNADIAEELNISVADVDAILMRVRLVADNRQANGYMRSDRKRGRPKKVIDKSCMFRLIG